MELKEWETLKKIENDLILLKTKEILCKSIKDDNHHNEVLYLKGFIAGIQSLETIRQNLLKGGNYANGASEKKADV